MPKINVYVPAWLAAALKESAVPVSAVCQQALAEAVQAPPDQAGGARPARRARADERALTNRARTVLRDARGGAGDGAGAHPAAALRLLDALEREGGNLAVVVLRSLGVPPTRPAALAAASAGVGDPARDDDGGGDLDELVDRAATIAADMGDRHVGCEHLLLALVDRPDGPVAAVLADAGADAVTVRSATRAAAAAAAYARSVSSASAMTGALASALDDIRARLGRLECR
ncbi:MAG: Clp protease N-terminal domain-containing protein [Motilibacteraceae bacterium]